MTINVAYDQQLSRVRVTYSNAPTDANAVRVQRSTDQVNWDTVRGGQAAALSSGSATVDDYEFAANVLNYYRAIPLTVDSFETTTFAVPGDYGDEWSRTQDRARSGRWSVGSEDAGPNESRTLSIELPSGIAGFSFWTATSSESGFDQLIAQSVSTAFLANESFESGTSPWTARNATVATSTDHFLVGSQSGEVTPDGSGNDAVIASEMVPVVGTDQITAECSIYPEQAGDAIVIVEFYDDSSTLVGSDSSDPLPVSAGSWQTLEPVLFTVSGATQMRFVVGMTSSPTASDVFWLDDFDMMLQRVLAVQSGTVPWQQSTRTVAFPDDDTLILTYSKDATVSHGFDAAYLDDLEVTYPADTASLTPTINSVWLKFIPRPFLNRAVTVTEWGDVTRPARNGVFEILGRSNPIAVTELRGSRRWNLTVMVDTPELAEEMDFILASGDPVFVHIPPDCGLPRSMYAVIGETTMSRMTLRGKRRYFDLPLTEVAAPAPSVVGSTVTYGGINASFATYQALLATEPTYASVLERITDPSVVIVP